ncbi:MAG: glyoxalase, partial [Gammaproteobacteria bacterium]
MQITSLKPFIPSGPDFGTAKAFFTDLGFTVNWETDGLAELQMDDAVFLLQDFHNQEMQSNLMMFVKVDDLDAWWQHLQSTGALERYEGVEGREPTEFPWGQ